MKTPWRNAVVLLLLLPLWFAGGALGASAQNTAAAFSKEQLEQIVAPIALYPDSLLMQVMAASTYPLEVVEADRFMRGNASLKNDALQSALKDKSWDPSVKSLCTLPDVLKRMSDNLDWTQDLGDAFLGQKTELMDSVQVMRNKAYDSGNLKTTEQQVVTQQPDKIIVIQQAAPEVVYVPSYSPTVVYGAWSYPSYYYPPMYAPPPYGYGLMTFGIGMAVGAAIWGDCDWGGGWGHGDVDIDVNRYNEFNRNTNINANRNQINANNSGRGNWQHDPGHRKGVNYRNQQTAQQFGARGGSSRVTRDQARGRSTAAGGTRQQAGTRDMAGSRQQLGTRDAAGARQQAGSRSTAQSHQRAESRQAADRSRSGASTSRQSRPSTATSGSRSPSMDRAATSRGSASRGTRSYGGSRGGMRSGGGGRRR